jgi:hypothetical protein
MNKTSEARDTWARIGASARLQQIEHERAEILSVFPELRNQKVALQVTSHQGRLRPRRKISAAARRAMAEGMRKYWAKRKAQQK